MRQKPEHIFLAQRNEVIRRRWGLVCVSLLFSIGALLFIFQRTIQKCATYGLNWKEERNVLLPMGLRPVSCPDRGELWFHFSSEYTSVVRSRFLGGETADIVFGWTGRECITPFELIAYYTDAESSSLFLECLYHADLNEGKRSIKSCSSLMDGTHVYFKAVFDFDLNIVFQEVQAEELFQNMGLTPIQIKSRVVAISGYPIFKCLIYLGIVYLLLLLALSIVNLLFASAVSPIRGESIIIILLALPYIFLLITLVSLIE